LIDDFGELGSDKARIGGVVAKGDEPWTFTSDGSPALTVTMGEKGSVQFRDGVVELTDADQAEELRAWAEENPGFGVSEGKPKARKEPAKAS